MHMETELNPKSSEYIVYDTREFPQKDAVYSTAVELADGVVDGIKKVANSHAIITAGLFITDMGAKLIILTRAQEQEPSDERLKCILKRVTFDDESGYMHTYVIPILEASATGKLEAIKSNES